MAKTASTFVELLDNAEGWEDCAREMAEYLDVCPCDCGYLLTLDDRWMLEPYYDAVSHRIELNVEFGGGNGYWLYHNSDTFGVGVGAIGEYPYDPFEIFNEGDQLDDEEVRKAASEAGIDVDDPDYEEWRDRFVESWIDSVRPEAAWLIESVIRRALYDVAYYRDDSGAVPECDVW